MRILNLCVTCVKSRGCKLKGVLPLIHKDGCCPVYVDYKDVEEV